MSLEENLHKFLGYTVFLVAVFNMGMVMTSARSEATMARIVGWAHSIGLIWLGRLGLLVGIGMIMRHRDLYLSSAFGYAWPAWVSLLLWGLVEVMAKRKIKPELQVVQDGGEASSQLVKGAGVQLLVMTIIFGLMHTIVP